MKRTILLTLLLACGTVVNAQTMPPNETDLHASYCIEVNNSYVDYSQTALSTLNNEPPSAVKDEALKASLAASNAINANLRKLQLYLVPRLSYIDPLGLLGASGAAKDDLARIRSATSMCEDKCPTPNTSEGIDAYTKCVSECAARTIPDLASIQKKLKSCSELDWLPF
jgi:hypothetical protein